MKKILALLIVCFTLTSISAVNLNGKKIYINPGHGGYNGANDRNLITIPYALEDTLGFWESKSNLNKGLYLRTLLQNSGATVIMSRILNRDEDDRPLSQIAEEANANNVDAFLSIHSNAVGTNTGTNYLLFLFRGDDNAPTVAASLPMANAAWPRLIDNPLTIWTHYTTTKNIRGDYSFYGYHLGVLNPLTVPGFPLPGFEPFVSFCAITVWLQGEAQPLKPVIAWPDCCVAVIAVGKCSSPMVAMVDGFRAMLAREIAAAAVVPPVSLSEERGWKPQWLVRF